MKFSHLALGSIASVLALSGTVRADDMAASTSASDFKFELHGFVSNSLYVQDTPDLILNGQGPMLQSTEPTGHKYILGDDVRQTRLNFSVVGPKVFGDATPKAVVEMDFFNLNGPGGFGEVSLVPRLRLAYAELNFGDTVVRAGQDWQLLSVNSPLSLGHQAFPVTWFNGQIGWREPGVSVAQTIHTGESKLEVAGQIMKGDWENPADFTTVASATNLTREDLNVDAGSLSSLPALELRAKWSMENLMAFVAAHWNHVNGTDLSNLAVPPTTTQQYGNLSAAPGRNWDVVAVKLGWSYTFADFLFQGQVYTGKNVAPLLGEELLWYTANDVHETGGWAQLAYTVNSNWNVSAVYGTSRLSVSDVASAGGTRYQSNVVGGMIQYKSGNFAVGPEFYHMLDKSLVASGAGAPDGVMDANQYMLTANYVF